MNWKLLILIFCSLNLKAAELKIITEDKPTLNYVKDGKLVGASVEIVQEIMKRLNVASTGIEVLPWARAYDLVLKEPNIGLFSTARIEPRENLFKWVGPLASKDWIFLARKDSKIKINSLDDAKKVKLIGTYREDSKEQYLKSVGFENIESVTEDSLNPKKLVAGRLDLWASSKTDYKLAIESEHLDLKDFKIAYTVKKQDLYLAISKLTDDALVQKWQAAFDSMLKDGTMARIRLKYTNID